MKLFVKKRKVFILLSVIFLVAAFLRFYKLSSNSPSLTWDEAAWGYNAYALGIDGRDEFGRFLPITYLESFGDYKPPVYAYLTILPVKVFGLNEFATRFASAFFGTLTVLLVFFLVRQLLFEWEKSRKNIVALLTSALLAVSPWHILLSRAAFEQNVATFFIVLGVYLFLVSVHKNGWLLILSVLSFLISMNTFNTARIVAPVLLVLLLLINIKHVFRYMKLQVVTAGIIGGILFIPLFLFLLTPQAKLRFAEVNIFSDSSVVLTANQEIANDGNAAWSKVLHNRRFGYAVSFMKHYFDNLTPSFLFIKGDGNPKFSIQDVGQMYIWEIPFVVLGLLYIFRKREKNRLWYFPILWLLISIIPAATARETPHALRIENMLPVPQFITAFGIYFSFCSIRQKVKGIPLKNVVIGITVLVALFNFSYFYHDYFSFYPTRYSSEWQYGYKQAISYAQSKQNNYNKIVMTKELGRPYIYVLFYEKYSPEKFRQQAQITREVYGFVHVHAFGKYVFRSNTSADIGKFGKALYIDTPWNVPKKAKVLRTFNLLDAKPSLVAYTMQ